MRRWLVLAALALFVCGCASDSPPKKEAKEEPKTARVPNGLNSPFDQ